MRTARASVRVSGYWAIAAFGFVTMLTLAYMHFSSAIRDNLVPSMNQVSIPLVDVPGLVGVPFAGLRVAVLGDLHADGTAASLAELERIVRDVRTQNPDMVFLLGDYVADVRRESTQATVRQAIVDRLKPLTTVPTFAILGNYEAYSEPDKWAAELSAAGIEVVEHRVVRTSPQGLPVCLRGLGDTFTNRFRFVPFPAACGSAIRITLTHDPAGAFRPGVEGLIFAGHTHCGQIVLPMIGAPFVPTDAPVAARCGLYRDGSRLLWVTSGLGTSVVPIRFGAPAQWDLITLTSTRGP
jgi:predicted MPP superfamily phosphohydrolase